MKLLETRDATGNMVGGVVAAAFGGPLPDAIQEMGRLVGDWALSSGGPAVSVESQPAAHSAEESPRRLTPFDTWLDPQLLWPEEHHEIRITATPPADFVRRADAEDIFTRSTFGISEAAVISNGVTARFQTPDPDRPPSSSGGAAPVASSDTALPSANLFPTGSEFIPTAPISAPFGANAAATSGDRATVDWAEFDEEIPNQAPQAVDDAITVDEDQSVVFDPTLNDTDPDGDPLWVKSVQPETGYGRLFWEEGGSLRYIPNPNYDNTTTGYSPPDTFTYVVTDGLAESTGTVSVTINAVNDAPVAFNDAATFVNTYTEPPNPPDQLVPLYAIGGDTNLFTNDIDFDGFDSNYDGQVLQIAATDMTGTVGQVAISPAGDMQWSVPWDYTGETEFRYQVIDDQGGVSDWATMKLWSVSSLTAPPVTANSDDFAVGDDPLTGNVVYNDSGGTVAILTSHPGSGQLTSFSMDGSFNYLPGLSRGGWFGYRLFSADGQAWAETKANLTGVNLTIYNGQAGRGGGGNMVSELNEHVVPDSELPPGGIGGSALIPIFKPTGAFTVANLNDSNVNGVVDSDINERGMAGDPRFPGSGEIDLMKLTLTKPPAIGNFKVQLTVTPAAVNTVRLWPDSLKAGDPVLIADGGANSVDFAVDDKFPTELWVELAGVSGAVGDVSIKMEYLGASDTVNATAIWTQNQQASPYWPAGYFMANGEKVLPPEADSRALNKGFSGNGGQLGLVDQAQIDPGPPPVFRTANAELSKFLLLPGNLTPYVALGIVSVDTSRSVAAREFVNGTALAPEDWPGWLDIANDDSDDGDEDNDLEFTNAGIRNSTNLAFALDSPGPSFWQAKADGVYLAENGLKLTDYIQRNNFYNFVRIQIGSPFAAGGTAVKGSRASVYYPWFALVHVHEYLPPVPQTWTLQRVDDPGLPAGQENRINTGHVDITKAGG